jgi:hypothetical protein
MKMMPNMYYKIIKFKNMFYKNISEISYTIN